MDDGMLETFFVYRSLRGDESWGAVLGCAPISRLPNADFVMKVFAKNEKHAISRARLLYEVIHKYDSDRDNVRRFACAALKTVILTEDDSDLAAAKTMDYALKMNEEFSRHFDNLDKEQFLKDLIEEAEQEGKEPVV